MKLPHLFWMTALVCTAGLKSVMALEVKPGGAMFAHYEFVTSNHLQNGSTVHNYNAFEVSRVYLNADASYSDKLSAFIQLEANLTSRDNKANRVYLKNAELRMNFNKYAKLYGGFVLTPWRSLEEGIWNHRYAAKTLEDIEGIGLATDRGIRFFGSAPYVNYDLMISNGEGTGGDSTAGNEPASNNAGGRFKDYRARFTFIPFESLGANWSGFKFNTFFQKGDKDESQLRNRIFAGLSYECLHGYFMATYYNADNSAASVPSRGEGFSVHTVIKPRENWAVFAKIDKYDPDIHAGNDAHNRYVCGVERQIIKGIRVSLDHHYLHQETRSLTRQDESILFVHTEAKF